MQIKENVRSFPCGSKCHLRTFGRQLGDRGHRRGHHRKAYRGLQSSSYKLKRRSSLNLLAAWNPLNSPWWWERRVRYLSLAAIFFESPTTDDHGAEGYDHHDLRPQ